MKSGIWIEMDGEPVLSSSSRSEAARTCKLLNQIFVDADFRVKSDKDYNRNPLPERYKAPPGSERERLMKLAHDLYHSGYKDEAYKLREEMEAAYRKKHKMKRNGVNYEGMAKKYNTTVDKVKRVYAKGLAAYASSGSRPGMTAHQWAAARVRSAFTGGKASIVDAHIINS